MAAWPDSLAYKQLSTDKNPSALLAACRDLYEGPGRECADRTGDHWFQELYLDRRQSDPPAGKARTNTNAGFRTDQENVTAHQPWAGHVAIGKNWESKKGICRYVNRVAGMLDHVVASVLKFRPRIVGPSDYWEALNRDVDGQGTDFIAFARVLCLETLVTGRPYVASLPRKGGEEKDLVLELLRRESITDGKPGEWLRAYSKTHAPHEAWETPTKDRYLWAYATPAEIVEYQLLWEKGKDIPPETKVPRLQTTPHELDGMPIEPVQIMHGLHAMRRLKDPTLRLYNLDSAIGYSIWRCAFPVPYLKTARGEIDALSFGEDIMPKLDPTDALDWFAAPNTHFDAAMKERDQARRDLYEVFASMAHHAAALATQNPRQSTTAKELDREPFALLLQTIADGLREALERVLRRVAVFRDEDADAVKITGLDEFATMPPDEADAQGKGLSKALQGTAEEGEDDTGEGGGSA